MKMAMINELRNTHIFTNAGLRTNFERLLLFSKRQLVTILVWGSPKLNTENTKRKIDPPPPHSLLPAANVLNGKLFIPGFLVTYTYFLT